MMRFRFALRIALLLALGTCCSAEGFAQARSCAAFPASDFREARLATVSGQVGPEVALGPGLVAGRFCADVVVKVRWAFMETISVAGCCSYTDQVAHVVTNRLFRMPPMPAETFSNEVVRTSRVRFSSGEATEYVYRLPSGRQAYVVVWFREDAGIWASVSPRSHAGRTM